MRKLADIRYSVQAMNLKQARKDNKLDEFIREHEDDPQGDMDAFDRMIETIAQPEKSKSTPGTSSQDSPAD